MGIERPFNVVQFNSEVENVVDLIAITVVQAQMHKLGKAK
jgi:phosphotransacetylase